MLPESKWEETEITFRFIGNRDADGPPISPLALEESTDFQRHCSMRGAVFLLSLKDVMEKGKGRPFPYDIEVHYR